MFVAGSGGELAADAGAGVAGGGREAGVQDPCCGLDPDAWHGGQELGKRVSINHFLDLDGELGALVKYPPPPQPLRRPAPSRIRS